MFKQEKGITLVSLVITIIVMLILAGVSLSMVMGDNSVLTQATDAVDETERATVSDEIALGIGAVQTKYYAQYANTTGKVTMYEMLTKGLPTNDFVNGTVELYAASGDKENVKLVYTHKNGNVYYTDLTVSTNSITVVNVTCVTRNSEAVVEGVTVESITNGLTKVFPSA